MKEIVNFLNLIVENNNRPWFQQHKDLYVNAQNKISRFQMIFYIPTISSNGSWRSSVPATISTRF